ncbi:ATP-binding protein, partial [Klebsiella pneumoniae]
SIDLDATPGTIIDADRDRIQRVVTQLLTNAVKFGEGRGIELKLLAENSHARLTVRDRGIGIDPKDHERIFGRFERAVGPSVAGGLGVGLYFARQAV